MGVPLTPQVPTHEHVAEAKYETVYKCEECNIGEYTFNPNNRNHECDNAFCGSVRYDLEQPNSSKSGGGLGDKGYELRTSYMKALLERYIWFRINYHKMIQGINSILNSSTLKNIVCMS